MSATQPIGRPLCRVEDISDPGARGFSAAECGLPHAIFVVRQGGRVVAYVNDCPHRRLPLDWMPDRFLDSGRTHILCATHGAVFSIADGHCQAGPCLGQSLTPVLVAIDGDRVVVADARPGGDG